MASLIEATLLAALGVFGLYFVVPALVKPLLRRRLLRRIGQGGRICLTFDDGPDPQTTPRILELLERAGARATFFMIGARAERHRELVRRVAQAGHEIGEHGFEHRNAWRSAPWTCVRDLWRGHAALADLGEGIPPTTLRPPFGKLNLLTLLYAWRKRRRLVFWDVDPRDYARQSPEDVARHVLGRLASGRVVLLHDGRVRPGSDPEVTVEAVRRILEHATAGGFRFATISGALAPQRNENGERS